MYNIDEIKKKIEKEYNENRVKMDNLKKSITIKMNSFKTKFLFFCACFIITGGLSILLFNGVANPSIIPSNLVYPIAIGLPTLIGITGERIISNKFKIKEKLKSFSKSKSDKEKIEESTRYELEIKKLEISNKILKETCKELEKQKLNNLTIMENQTLNTNNKIKNTYLNYQIDDDQNIKENKNVLVKRKVLKNNNLNLTKS